MADPSSVSERIVEDVRKELSGSPYEITTVTPLSGGTANWIFCGDLKAPLPDDTTQVVVKHGEAFVASNPNFPLVTSRCKVEEECLKRLASFPPVSTSVFDVDTPALHYFNSDTNTQVQEYLPNATALKQHCLADHHAAPPGTEMAQYRKLGRGIGTWLRRFHDWANSPAQSSLREVVSQNKAMQGLKNMINYQALASKVQKYPDLLSDASETIGQVQRLAASELASDSSLSVIHGDFWTGNILLPNVPLDESASTPVKVIDWELAQLGVLPLDLGQMVAEMYQLKLFKDIDRGVWLIEGFADGYGQVDDDFAFRVLLHVGVHMMTIVDMSPGWGTPEQVASVISTGKNIMVKSMAKDKAFFEGGALGAFFARGEEKA